MCNSGIQSADGPAFSRAASGLDRMPYRIHLPYHPRLGHWMLYVAVREGHCMKHDRWMIALCASVAACADQPARVSTSLQPSWITTLEHCQIWDPFPRVGETASWSGSCVGGFIEGPGRIVWSSPDPTADEGHIATLSGRDLKITSVVDGQMVHGFIRDHAFEQFFDVKTGKIRYTVDGYFRDSRLEGMGTVVTSGGSRYVGSFHLGKYDGHGVFQYPKGARYEGDFHDGNREGHGLLTWGQGNSYAGDFHLGWPDGSGKLTTVGSGKDNLPLTLTGTWQRGCFLDPARFGCIQIRPN